MRVFRILATTSALLFSAAVLFISLSTVSSVQSSTGERLSGFKISGDVMPGHIGYFLLVATDKARLEMATPLEVVYLKTEYANRRLGYAEKLLEKGEAGMAVTTATKAQKYLLEAGNQVIDLEMSDTVAEHVLETLEFHVTKTESFSEELTDQQRAVIDSLNEECRVMIMQLESRL